MISAESVVARGGHEGEFADTITLDKDQRHRRRMAMVSDGGIAFLLDLAGPQTLREGDGILLDDGRVIEVKAKPEPLYEVSGPGGADLLRIAWHLGRRQLAVAFGPDRILVPRAEGIREVVEGLGGSVTAVEAAFDPDPALAADQEPVPGA